MLELPEKPLEIQGMVNSCVTVTDYITRASSNKYNIIEHINLRIKIIFKVEHSTDDLIY